MALEFLVAQIYAQPDLAEWYDDMAYLYQRKLWHQLTAKLEQFVVLPAVQTGDVLIQLYSNVIEKFETEIHLLKLAYIAMIVSRQYSDKDDAIKYLGSIIGRLIKKPEWMVREPIIFMSVQIAACYFEKGDLKQCRMILEYEKYRLDCMTDVDPLVLSNYYWIASQLHKFQLDFAEFYKSALLFLTYASLESLPVPLKQDLAFELSLSVLMGEGVYNFGELLAHPIIDSLIGTTREWIYHILQAFNSGNLIRYQELCQIHNAALYAHPQLVAQEWKLHTKIKIMCLMDIIYCWSSEDRTIPLSIIAERTQLSMEDVDFFLIRAFSDHLIKGIIDQVEGTVYVSWVRPRALGIPQIKSLRDRLDLSAAKVRTALSTDLIDRSDSDPTRLSLTSNILLSLCDSKKHPF